MWREPSGWCHILIGQDKRCKSVTLLYFFLYFASSCPPISLTGADVHDVVEGVSALDDVHHQLGEAQVVLGEQRVDGERLDHVVHEEEPLGVLEAALGQVPPRPPLLQRATLRGDNKETLVLSWKPCGRHRGWMYPKRDDPYESFVLSQIF